MPRRLTDPQPVVNVAALKYVSTAPPVRRRGPAHRRGHSDIR